MPNLIRIARGTRAAWLAANPVLPVGVPAFETDTGKIRVGDGATAYADLPSRTYTPPEGGIPETELDRDLLGKIDAGARGEAPDRALPAAFTVDPSQRLSVGLADETEARAAFPVLDDEGVRVALQARSERPDWETDGEPGTGPNLLSITADHAALLQALGDAQAAGTPDAPGVVTVTRPMRLNRALTVMRSCRIECVGAGRLVFEPGGFPQNMGVFVRPYFLEWPGADRFTDEQMLGDVPAVFVDGAQGHAEPEWGGLTLTLPGALPPVVAAGAVLWFRAGRNPKDSMEPAATFYREVEDAVDNGDGTSTVTLTRALPARPESMTVTIDAVGATVDVGGEAQTTVTLAEPTTMMLKEHDERDFAPNPILERTVLRFSNGAVAQVAAGAAVGATELVLRVTEGALEAGASAEWGVEHVVMPVAEEPRVDLDLAVEFVDNGRAVTGGLVGFGGHVTGRGVRVAEAERAVSLTACRGRLDVVHLGRQTVKSNARVIDVQDSDLTVDELSCDYLVGSLTDVEGPEASLIVRRARARLADAPGSQLAIINHNVESRMTSIDVLRIEGGGLDETRTPKWTLFAAADPTFTGPIRSLSVSIGHLQLAADLNNVDACYVRDSIRYESPHTGVRRYFNQVVTRRFRRELGGTLAPFKATIFGVPKVLELTVGAADNAAFDVSARQFDVLRPEAAVTITSQLADVLTAGVRTVFEPKDGGEGRISWRLPCADAYDDRLMLRVDPLGVEWPAGTYVEARIVYFSDGDRLTEERADSRGWWNIEN